MVNGRIAVSSGWMLWPAEPAVLATAWPTIPSSPTMSAPRANRRNTDALISCMCEFILPPEITRELSNPFRFELSMGGKTRYLKHDNIYGIQNTVTHNAIFKPLEIDMNTENLDTVVDKLLRLARHLELVERPAEAVVARDLARQLTSRRRRLPA